ncbi:Formyltransferase [Violaceomyces palustris]|uniref:Formyltransferase n=1 Tax=Violaceomyces palustris TaxID=1673888 RepID=A0ACD0P150_9BASI|nr:Formyltransferase [Violaceomyces palustris]
MTLPDLAWIGLTRKNSPLLLVSSLRIKGSCLQTRRLSRTNPIRLDHEARRRITTTPPPPPPYDILFCGTDEFARESLKAIAERKELFESIHVLTPPDSKTGWGSKRMKVSAVKRFAIENGLDQEDLPRDAGFLGWQLPDKIRRSNRRLLIAASFGHMIPDSVIESFGHASQALNLHPSLLPQLRGAAPIQWAIARDLKTTGVSVQELGKGEFDRGRILSQKTIEIPPLSTFSSLEPRLAKLGSSLLVQVISQLPKYSESSWSQHEAEATNAFKVKRDDVEVKWAKWTAQEIHARYRGFGYLYKLSTNLVPLPRRGKAETFPTVRVLLTSLKEPGHLEALAELDRRSHDILSSETTKEGMATFSDSLGALVVKCKGDTFLRVDKLQVEKKGEKEAREWWRGFRDRGDDRGRILFEFLKQTVL